MSFATGNATAYYSQPYKLMHYPTIACEIINLQVLKRDTLILLFSRPDNGKQLATTARAHRQAWLTLQQHSRQQAAASGLPVQMWDASQQVGKTFAQRLTHALCSLQQEGWEHIIIIGDDCPELHHKQLTEAAYALQNGQPVLGPDKDGGAYLIGLSLINFNPNAFLALPWQTDQLLSALSAWLSLSGSLYSLSPQQDINTLYALQQVVVSHKLISALQHALASLLISCCPIWQNTFASSLYTLSTTSYRGPPSVV